MEAHQTVDLEVAGSIPVVLAFYSFQTLESYHVRTYF